MKCCNSAEEAASAAEKIDELRALRKKRKAEGAGEDEEVEKAFIEADRIVLAKLRADETPAQTRSTVLCAAETVSFYRHESACKLYIYRIDRRTFK